MSVQETLRGGGNPGVERETVLDIKELSKFYGETPALREVSLQVRQGELLTLLGPSGSGKTTLLKVIAGFEAPTAGKVLLRGRDISRLSPARRGVGMVFQHYALFPHMTVAQNVGYGLKLRRVGRAARDRRVGEMLELLRLDGLEGRYPRQLSGGQQQRVALGRALAYDPEVILMDEPLGALDRALRIEMEEQIRGIHRELGATIVYVTHDQQEALALSDRIAIMRAGRLASVGEPAQLYARPADSFVASFFANANLLAVSEHELLDDGSARVRCGGGELRCATSAKTGDRVVLAVRRRSLGRTSSPGSLRIAGPVAEMLLFGDEQEISIQSPALGRVVATIDSRACVGIALGMELELFAAAGEAVLVPLV
ncbi:MAG TPA: ABC transporter ATP-binding protein [Solirubrobacteraceae bacterium]|nr:ABC transporter ATP-binding protein [Solirubrobacteraceae bacterium]